MKLLQKMFYVISLVLVIVLPVQVNAQTIPLDDSKSIYDDTVWYDTTIGTVSTGCSTGAFNVVGSDNIQNAMSFLLGKGLTAMQAAGIIGNLEQESGQGLNPSADQSKGSASYPTPGVGFGIAQWTDTTRQQGLLQIAQKEGKSPNDLGVQLDYLWQELTTGYLTVLQHLKATSAVPDAVNQFVGPLNYYTNQPAAPTDEVRRAGGYENPGTPKMSNRLDFANQAFNKYGAATGSTGPASCGSSVSISCSGAGPADTTSATDTNQVRQNVVCIAENELKLWQSQPGYPHPAYSQSGYFKYSQNQPEEWCADFASWVYDQAGYPLKPDPDWRIAYVPNIQTVGEANGNFHWHPQGSNYTPKPGDLAIHGPNHVNIFISSQGGTSQYIGGDQGDGPYPGGSIVSIETGSGYYDNGITGYVSPD